MDWVSRVQDVLTKNQKTKTKKQTREELKEMQGENERLSQIIISLTTKQSDANQLTTRMADEMQEFKKSVAFFLSFLLFFPGGPLQRFMKKNKKNRWEKI